ncbi:MAG: 4Fe-4S dicluster domain-containing protein [Candidatus Aminicenantes bacterium]|nr:4Fe-4S dicluster domain-containing protein [Candidatus Aminicenantes bacterium]
MGDIVLVALSGFFFLFAVSSYLEREWRAFKLSGFALIALILFFVVWTWVLPFPKQIIGFGLFVVGAAFALWVALSRRPRTELKVAHPPQKIDERDVIFARFDLVEGSQRFKDYYVRRPEYADEDNKIRELPDILTAHHLEKQPWLYSLAGAEFDFLEAQLDQVDGEVAVPVREGSAQDNTCFLKNIVHYLGSTLCGICELDPSFLYSHVGRGPAPYGQRIELSHAYALVFAVEMEYAMIASAPHAPVIVETAKQYVEAAKISIVVAGLIRALGYSARAHIAGSNYNAMLTPLAWKAGLGELGRLGILMTKDLGPRIRLGLVTTDLPLVTDTPITFGALDFCRQCKKCAVNCPSQAIPKGEPGLENGVWKWTIDREACYRYWRKAGTDCARCIYVCPYSKPNNLFHNLIRNAMDRSKATQWIAHRGDELFYGRYPRPLDPPL